MPQHLVASAALAALAMSLVTGATRADEIYILSGTYRNPETNVAGIGPYTATFDLTDEQVATGGFILSGRGNGGAYPPELGFPPGINAPDIRGDVAGFESISFTGDQITPTYLYGSLQYLNMTFDPLGNLTSINANWGGVSDDSTIATANNNITLSWLDDDMNLCSPPHRQTCVLNLSVYHIGDPLAFTSSSVSSAEAAPGSIPEPATFALLGLVSLCAAAINRARSRTPPGG